jgi:hypothetical protein
MTAQRSTPEAAAINGRKLGIGPVTLVKIDQLKGEIVKL